jgi:YbbR domain-containing protein
MSPIELLRRLLHNWPIKLAALLTATILWYQLREVEPVVERSLERPLEVVGVDAERRPVGLPGRVLVRLRGTARILKNLHPNAVVTFVDLSGVEEGPFTVPVQVRTPSGVRVVEVVPAEVSAVLERQGAAVLPVVVFAPENVVSYDPKSVEARGAASLVERARAAIGVDMDGKGKVTLVPVDDDGRPVEGLELDPAAAEVEVVGPLLTSKEVDLVLAPPPEDLRPVSVKVPARVVVVGPPKALEGVSSVIAKVDWRVGEYTTALELSLPEGVSVIGSVLAQLKVEPVKPLE